MSDTSDVFLAGGLSEDIWTCDVTPYDGTDYGFSVSDSVTVESGCSSLDFDGVGNEVSVSDISQIPTGNAPRSVSVWFYPEDDVDSNLISWGSGLSTYQRFSIFSIFNQSFK